jgi:hypothetical protein
VFQNWGFSNALVMIWRNLYEILTPVQYSRTPLSQNSQNFSGFLPSSCDWDQWLRLALSKGPNWVGVVSPTFTRARKQIQFPKRRVFWNTGRWKKSRKIMWILYNIHHRQNPFKPIHSVSSENSLLLWTVLQLQTALSVLNIVHKSSNLRIQTDHCPNMSEHRICYWFSFSVYLTRRWQLHWPVSRRFYLITVTKMSEGN